MIWGYHYFWKHLFGSNEVAFSFRGDFQVSVGEALKHMTLNLQSMVSGLPESNMEGTTPSGNDLDQFFKHIQSPLNPVANDQRPIPCCVHQKTRRTKGKNKKNAKICSLCSIHGTPLILEKKRIYTRDALLIKHVSGAVKIYPIHPLVTASIRLQQGTLYYCTSLYITPLHLYYKSIDSHH